MQRMLEKSRKTNETDIKIKLNLDGSGIYRINTPNCFFNHMLEQLCAHSDVDIELDAIALDNNLHHLVEDCAIVLGAAISDALGENRGIKRYSSIILPMDDALIMCALDISKRPYFKLDADFEDEKTGDFEVTLLRHFFRSLAVSAGFCLHIKKLDGFDTHHIIEAIFKAFARCLKDSIKVVSDKIPSTKGQL